MSSLDFLLLSFKLLFSAHFSIFANSSFTVFSLVDATNKYVSSAYFMRQFLLSTVFRSLDVNMYVTGPIADPCTTLAFISHDADSCPSIFVLWVRLSI